MVEPERVDQANGDASGAQAPPSRPRVTDAIADLIELFVTYVRQETGDLVRDKVVRPTQRAGEAVAFALAAASVLFLGIGYVSVAVLLVLAAYMGWPGALLLVGGVLILAAAGFAYLKTRSMQR